MEPTVRAKITRKGDVCVIEYLDDPIEGFTSDDDDDEIDTQEAEAYQLHESQYLEEVVEEHQSRRNDHVGTRQELPREIEIGYDMFCDENFEDVPGFQPTPVPEPPSATYYDREPWEIELERDNNRPTRGDVMHDRMEHVRLGHERNNAYCLCRRPASGQMVMCEGCDEWYHLKCIKLTPSKVKEIKKYYCRECEYILNVKCA